MLLFSLFAILICYLFSNLYLTICNLLTSCDMKLPTMMAAMGEEQICAAKEIVGKN
jgi:hypothetical protein